MLTPKDRRLAKLSWNQLEAASDCELMVHLAAGAHDALAVIVDRYQRLVLSVALRIVKDLGEAEDVAQIVFADIFKKVEQFDPSRGTLKMWLLQYAYSRSINRRHYLERRKFYSSLNVDDVSPFSLASQDDHENGWSAGEAARLIRQALASLKPQQQAAIESMYFEGLTLEEAALRAGETIPAMRHHYYRGLAKLREFIHTRRPGQEAETLKEAIQLEVPNFKPRPV